MKSHTRSKPFAKRSFGQNFLSDGNCIDKIIRALDPRPDETVVEIGPGRGALTGKLVEKGSNVVAIELDTDLIPLLRQKFGDRANFRLIEDDALRVDFGILIRAFDAEPARAKLVANLPYNISTAILQYLIDYRGCFSEMVLMLQKEVVERITADPGHKERGYLTVLIEAYFESRKLFEVPPNAFRPAPKVQSAVVRLIPKPALEIVDPKRFSRIVSLGFRQKRKTILNNLKNEKLFGERTALEHLAANGIDPKLRPEDLTLEQWVLLSEPVLD
ncbi:MAG: 16S rRNA (adenine(1518)-N(6)/adenine(1519)-N(6))-dimethyltransferase RsmA [Acidobacteria bacterium]|nr:16S rRNA (adenine(1518)-N(6)/adenine(1519)-N(6))-dimethyltransferase RsmA [Acidobacteriota bacterium]